MRPLQNRAIHIFAVYVSSLLTAQNTFPFLAFLALLMVQKLGARNLPTAERYDMGRANSAKPAVISCEIHSRVKLYFGLIS